MVERGDGGEDWRKEWWRGERSGKEGGRRIRKEEGRRIREKRRRMEEGNFRSAIPRWPQQFLHLLQHAQCCLLNFQELYTMPNILDSNRNTTIVGT